MTLNEIADLATAVGILLTAFGLMLVAYQVKLQRNDQKNQAIARLFDEVVTREFRQMLLFVYSKEPENLVLDKLFQSEREMVEEVTGRLDLVGYRVRTGVFPKQEALDHLWDVTLRWAQQLRLHILDQQEKRGEAYKFKPDFEWLTREAKLFQLKKLGRIPVLRNMSLDDLLKMEPLPIFRVELIKREGVQH